ncbi:pelargonidin 3-O-(6-caffeoylglucoside) 5-O-(6-O-malonylglucoside) 4'''-malonyltransferase-like [Actinidia eriantha]|uniref:pelargonidin 3-O-(6-caffeoylglucoside) 5-O-(6-O-malonylglucoside) 4'''-malonyltransferase-like n=1 Tax=Actinidia eriantha TaxID=165200 RepID=UPI00258B77FA|nr:pelargonidin 3-O-(6-caffeoylglucoside) 5-O-(6-O-malonylglucoside) 4'''-malonyltransferase-like [Actinidia eriantha]
MAMLHGTTTDPLPKPQIEAVQSVTILKVTDPPSSRHVSLMDSFGSSVFQRWFHIIFYYNQQFSAEDSGWLLAGWTKESLGRALEEEPVLAGRLRRGGEEGGAELEIVSNDSGVRLFEARISKTLAEFLDLEDREREATEAEIVFWNDIDEQNPQSSPLLYVQVTNFQCGGYSIGISCSLLVADPMAITSFLRRWAKIHNKIVSEAEMTKLPLFYLPNLKPNSSPLTNQTGSNRTKDRAKTLIFRVGTKGLNLNDEAHLALALLCMEEVEIKLGVKMASKFSLLVEEPSKGLKVESYLREGLLQKPLMEFKSELNCACWDDFGGNEVIFYGGNKPVWVSYWINSVPSEGLVIVIPSPDSETNIVVAF